MKRTVYISGALIGSGNLAHARAKYEYCAKIINDSDFTPYLPHQNTDPHFMADASAEGVYSTDIEALLSSDAVVAFLDEPSHGVGAEIAICAIRRIPLVALVHSAVRPSRFIVGMIENSEQSTLIRYGDLTEIAEVLPSAIWKAIRSGERHLGDGFKHLLVRN